MSWGAIYCESWFGAIGSDGWGSVYPIRNCGGITSDTTNTLADTNLITADNGSRTLTAFDCSLADFNVANGSTGATISINTNATVVLGTLNSVSPTTYQSGSATYTANITAPSGFSNTGQAITSCTDTATGTSGPGSIVSTQYALLVSYGGVNITFTYNGVTYSRGLTETISDITNLNGGSSSYGTNSIRFDTASPGVGSYMTDGFGTFINSNNTHVGFAPYAAFSTPKFMTVKLNQINPFPNPLNVYPIYKIEQANGFIQITQKITS